MKLAIIGAGGHGRELADIARASAPATTSISFWDDALREGRYDFGSVSGTIEDLVASDCTHYLIGVGDPAIRKSIASRLAGRTDLEAYSAIHPAASLGSRSTIGPGSVVGPRSVVTCDVRIGDHTHLHSNVVVAHDCDIGSFVVVTPGVSIAGDVVIKDSAWLGVGSTINRGIEIGARSLVGAGAVVISDVNADDIVAGVPARSLDPSSQR